MFGIHSLPFLSLLSCFSFCDSHPCQESVVKCQAAKLIFAIFSLRELQSNSKAEAPQLWKDMYTTNGWKPLFLIILWQLLSRDTQRRRLKSARSCMQKTNHNAQSTILQILTRAGQHLQCVKKQATYRCTFHSGYEEGCKTRGRPLERAFGFSQSDHLAPIHHSSN